MRNKIVLITGTNSGIGKDIVSILKREKCTIVATSRNKKIIKKKDNIHYLNLDITNEDHWKKTRDYIKTNFGKLDTLINNAGVRKSGNIETTSIKEWDDIFKTNITSIFLGCKYCIPLLKKSKNSTIVNVGSITGIRGVKNMISYSSSKGAVVTFTASLALDLAKHGIRVNSVAPGAVDTKMIWSLRKEINSNIAFEKRMKESHPIGRIAKPKEIAEVIVFLASQKSSFMTGLTLPVDGGRSIR